VQLVKNTSLKVKYLTIGLFIFLIGITGYAYYQKSSSMKKLSYNDFWQKVEQKQVREVYLTDQESFQGKLVTGDLFISDNPRRESFKEDLLTQNVIVHEKTAKSDLEKGLGILFIFSLAAGLILYISKSGVKQTQNGFSKYTTMAIEPQENVQVTFDDIAGNEEAKDSVRELVDFIKEPEKYAKYGARMPRGIIFYGPPGTGKTLMAKALAGEAGVRFYSVSGSDFVQVYVGVGAGRIRDLFKRARQHGKCVIFIDEIDALGKRRDSSPDGGGNDERDQTLNALLAEMSGFQDRDGIIVIAATNRLDILDEALLRPGRFDRHIEIGLPDVNARYEILKLHSRNKLMAKDIDLKKVAYQTVYFSGAKLENMMNEAAINAARRDAGQIEMEDIDKAFYTVIVGAEKKDRSAMSFEDKKITAYHEAGHALVTKLVAPENRVSRITIIPSSNGVGGFSMNIPPDRMHYRKKDLINNIRIALAGRAAEELAFGEESITSGASNDIENATEIVVTMLKKLGMNSNMGLINYDILYKHSCYGDDTEFVKESKSILAGFYDETKEILSKNWAVLEHIVRELLEKETIDEDRLDHILRKNVIVA
jgi:cell division protease FtsH